MPNFLIIGAAKCGTTGLYEFLRQHPQVYMSPVKEPGFFALEGRTLDFCGPGDAEACREGTIDLASYQKLFAGVRDEIAIGEASAAYLSTPGAAEKIHHYIPDAKLIVLLRNPIERAYSSFMHMRRDNREPHEDFAAALADEDNRIRAGWEPIWQYRARGFYAAQLQRYFELFSRERIKIYLASDLRTGPAEVTRDIFRFLEVDDSFVPDVSCNHNVSGIPQRRWLHTFLTHRSPIKTVLKCIVPKSYSARISSRLLDNNLVKTPMPPDIRAQLRATYREDILQLQELIDRDLSSWLK